MNTVLIYVIGLYLLNYQVLENKKKTLEVAIFSSPEPKAQVSYCHSAPSVVRPSVVRPSSVCKLLNFQLLLQNRLMDFDETW